MILQAAAKESTVCATCGSPRLPDVPFGLCPRCLLNLGLARKPEEDAATSSPEVPKLGDSLEGFDYELLERLGRGGMGVVYRARQRSLDRIVAVKMIAMSDSASPAVLARFRREAEMAAKLDHPNIVSIIEVGECQANPYLVMRLVEGESLLERMGELALRANAKGVEAYRGQETIAKLMSTAARAVEFAHKRGVLHRDLKPSNILLDLEGRPHLTDFGIAKSLDQDTGLTQTAELLGTLSYMAPEQAAGKATGRAADVYSMGAILYELLTGQRPFQGPKMEILHSVIANEPTPPRALNPVIERDLATICLKCLDKNPARRYQSALALAEDLERWLRREPVLAREAGPVIRLQRWTVRNPAVATLVATLSIGIVVCLTLLMRANQEKERKSIALDILRSESARQLQEVWSSTNAFFAVKSETLATMAGMEIDRLQETEMRFTIALVAQGNPLERVIRAAPMLSQLEQSMSELMEKPTRLDLRLYKDHARAVEDFARREVDFAQLNALDFLRARERDPDVRPLIRFEPTVDKMDSVVVFTRKDKGIQNIADLQGKSLLLGMADSTMNFWTKAALVSAGIHGKDLGRYRYIDRPTDFLPAGKIAPAATLGNPFSSMTPVEAVMSGQYDAAVVREKRFQEVASEQGLVALERFSDSGDLLAAKGDLPRDVMGAFRRVVLTEDPAAAAHTFLQASAKFRPAKEEDFRGVLDNLGAETAFEP